jgi:hypothetical protein
MANRKLGPVVMVAGVVIVGALAYGSFAEQGKTARAVDTGGGTVPAAAGPVAPYSVSTLPPVGFAAQDPGGGGGGGGRPGNVGTPAIQGAQGAGAPQGTQGGGDTFYLSGVNTLDPSRSAVTSGENTFPTPTGTVGSVLAPAAGGTSTSGCSSDPQSVEYDWVPLTVQTVGFRGTPRVHLRITGGGPVSARIVQFSSPDRGGSCQTLSTGSGSIAGGIADFSLSPRSLTFSRGSTPGLVISAPVGSHTISTSNQNPSFLRLPGLFGA